MFVTPQNIRWATGVITREIDRRTQGKRFTLKQPCILTVNIRGQRVTTRDEAFAGSESFIASGVIVAEDGYTKYKSVVILRPTWPADFSNVHLDVDKAALLLEGFDVHVTAANMASGTDFDKARKVFELAASGQVATASKEQMKDELFGSW